MSWTIQKQNAVRIDRRSKVRQIPEVKKAVIDIPKMLPGEVGEVVFNKAAVQPFGFEDEAKASLALYRILKAALPPAMYTVSRSSKANYEVQVRCLKQPVLKSDGRWQLDGRYIPDPFTLLR